MHAGNREQIIRQFLSAQGWGAADYNPLAGDASFRRYVRLKKNNESRILMDAPPEHEKVDGFVLIARYLVEQGVSAPRLYAEDTESGLLLLEDLGEQSFTLLLSRGGQVNEQELYAAAVEALMETQRQSRKSPVKVPLYDQERLLQETALFADWYMPALLGAEKAAALKPEFMALWEKMLALLPGEADVFVHRDYHADNLFWLQDRKGIQRVGMLDFQDAVMGHPAYDLVSLLEDARRDVSPQLADSMIDYFIENMGSAEDKFRLAYALLGAQRNTKIIGIFTRLCVRDGKPHYLKHLPRVWRYLEHDLAHPALKPLRQWLDTHVPPALRGQVLTLQKQG